MIGNNKVNEFKAGSTREDLWIGDRRIFSPEFDSIPFDIETGGWPGLAYAGVTRSARPGRRAAASRLPGRPAEAQSGAKLAINSFSEQFTYTPSNHTLKAGFGFSDNQGTFIQAQNQVGTFTFNGNQPFDPANVFTYPIRFQATLGNIRFPIDDKRTYVVRRRTSGRQQQGHAEPGHPPRLLGHDPARRTPSRPGSASCTRLTTRTAIRAAFRQVLRVSLDRRPCRTSKPAG